MTEQSMPSTGAPAANRFRIGLRTALRSVRPLFTPLLNRMQLRMRSAVEQSSLVPSLRDIDSRSQIIETKLQNIETKLEDCQLQFAKLQTVLKELGMHLNVADKSRTTEIETQTAEITAAIAMLQIARKFEVQTAELTARLDVLQVSCDVLRLNQIEADKLDRQSAM